VREALERRHAAPAIEQRYRQRELPLDPENAAAVGG
jgi:hypothetical protein